ncbi:MAG: hypothetical protein ACT4O5_01825 [Gammaproteobacteria bacterium]
MPVRWLVLLAVGLLAAYRFATDRPLDWRPGVLVDSEPEQLQRIRVGDVVTITGLPVDLESAGTGGLAPR